MRFEVFTLFPEVFAPYLQAGILQKAVERGLVTVNLYDLRDYTHDKHRTTDDTPYGGGGGMVMKPEPVFEAVEAVLGIKPRYPEYRALRHEGNEGGEGEEEPGKAVYGPVAGSDCPVILLTPQGRVFNQRIASELARHERMALICGRYEGFDERIREHLATDEISVGDYVLTGGELPALIIIDAVTRLAPGALGDPGGAEDDSHALGLLEYPHYTRPPEFRGWRVPEVLLSGDHARIERWRREQSILRTLARRPDLLESAELSGEERKFVEAFGREGSADPGGKSLTTKDTKVTKGKNPD